MAEIKIVCDYPRSPRKLWQAMTDPAKLLGAVRKKMLTVGLPALLANLDDTGALRKPLAGA
ncbi:hypothetical protein EV645_5951 [Kribbella rubisoli]|uniref:Uncharacterized protein n=1 Tax=Kribbella rubisoli TaxID=3075929 RepID=A0A4Q7WS54_9ACTN|nr:hypothetical protein [Kribbella rubisoli]RZU12678.1 hypothetical protein EV645_5951 [Kribbella rubisoli]